MRFLRSNPNAHRYLSILVTLIAILAISLLAAGLRSLEFEPARQFGFYKRPGGLSSDIIPFNLDWLMVGLLIFSTVIFIVGIIMLVVSPEVRKIFWRYFKPMIILLTAYAILLYFYRPTEEVNEAPPLTTPYEQPVDLSEALELEAAEEVPYSPPDAAIWQKYLIGISVIIFIGIAGYAIWIQLKPQEEDFVEIARAALGDLHEGRDWDDSVIQCYVRMNNAVRQKRRLQRNQSMTPREFASLLEKYGLPAEPISMLTKLFEKARYGTTGSGEAERAEAIECLSNILEAIEEAE